MHSASKRVPRRLRLRFWLTRTLRWLVPEARCLSFPVAVRRNRFLVALCVRRNRFLVALCVFILCDMAVGVFPMKLLIFKSSLNKTQKLVKLESRILERLCSFLKVFSPLICKSADFASQTDLRKYPTASKDDFASKNDDFSDSIAFDSSHPNNNQ